MEMNHVSKSSAQLLHFVAAIDFQRGMLSFYCERQPLATVRIFGTPTRCPFCQQENSISTSFSMKQNKEKA
jgi:hypothetical protein